ncbi:MAG: hypothetical protein ACLVJH_07935 [Faecalibacterium prausnitzii]
MAHNDTHTARKKAVQAKILLVVLLLLVLAAGASGAVCLQRDQRQW